jgi:hypothetical protein
MRGLTAPGGRERGKERREGGKACACARARVRERRGGCARPLECSPGRTEKKGVRVATPWRGSARLPPSARCATSPPAAAKQAARAQRPGPRGGCVSILLESRLLCSPDGRRARRAAPQSGAQQRRVRQARVRGARGGGATRGAPGEVSEEKGLCVPRVVKPSASRRAERAQPPSRRAPRGCTSSCRTAAAAPATRRRGNARARASGVRVVRARVVPTPPRALCCRACARAPFRWSSKGQP